METANRTGSEETVLSVTELNRQARYLLEDHFPAVLVEGEISNIAMPASGHWYLTLKDESAQVRCAMFRNRNMRVRFRPADGMQVLIRAKLSIYENRGDYQLIIEQMEERGDGALLRAFEALKSKLLAEGLFDDSLKKPIPDLPRHIGVITSPTGAAVRDIISALGRRFPAIKVTVIPVTVQGSAAAGEIINAIRLANGKRGCLSDLDVLVVGRGGGSLEDLWCFNDEALARAIAGSELPVVSAVGHEVDFTIADFVADLRAATPTAAAELLSPDQAEYALLFKAYSRQFTALVIEGISRRRQKLVFLQKRLRHPGRRLQDQFQKLDDLEARLRRACRHHLKQFHNRVRHMHQAIRLHSPLQAIRSGQQQRLHLNQRLLKSMRALLQQKKSRLGEQSHALQTVSPLNTLSRGYSITSRENGAVIRTFKDVSPGDRIVTRLHEGRVVSTVDAPRATDE